MENQKKKGGCLKIILIVIAVIAVILIIAAVAGGGQDTPVKVENTDSERNQTDDATEESEEQNDVSEQQASFGVGETAEMNDVQVTMTGYEESSGSEYNTPADGNEFVLIDFEIANNSDSELNISSMLSFEAYADDYALNYSLNAMIENEDEAQLDGTIAPGKKMSGAIGYEVPTDWSELEIHFTDNVWSNNKFVFVIGR